MGTWFRDSLLLKVRNGSSNLFWVDRWVGDFPLRVRFRRLFYLSENKLLTMAQMFHLGWDEGGGVEVEKKSKGMGEGVLSGVLDFINVCCVEG